MTPYVIAGVLDPKSEMSLLFIFGPGRILGSSEVIVGPNSSCSRSRSISPISSYSYVLFHINALGTAGYPISNFNCSITHGKEFLSGSGKVVVVVIVIVISMSMPME